MVPLMQLFWCAIYVKALDDSSVAFLVGEDAGMQERCVEENRIAASHVLDDGFGGECLPKTHMRRPMRSGNDAQLCGVEVYDERVDRWRFVSRVHNVSMQGAGIFSIRSRQLARSACAKFADTSVPPRNNVQMLAASFKLIYDAPVMYLRTQKTIGPFFRARKIAQHNIPAGLQSIHITTCEDFFSVSRVRCCCNGCARFLP